MRILKYVSLLVLMLIALSVYADEPVEGRAGRAEVRFMEGMIDHHTMAIDMSQVCLNQAVTESVQQLCQDIIDAQSAEIATLQGWLADWYGIRYEPMSMMQSGGMMPSMATEEAGMMNGMMDDMPTEEAGMMNGMMQNLVTDPPGMMGMMAFLDRTEGVEFETAYLEAMADHHDDAIHMAERILSQAEHQPLRDMAQQIIDDQTREIEHIEQLLTELGEPATQ